ncbi:acyltransferase family protein [Echinicola vietnamensis]|uniref:Putative acyltransferase n=1 Tax=Echinicola vietnamensis (strain DSM 17526 / LMG 23754 / KMM 6221) TaxID=926556 RepID=L0G2B3_ECHVK|nr:acyltransferase [Echinicola vietnamensis]AGA78990.1 putative acyltransferase [Echinicola vietnamensis DSM 17526]
MNNTIEKKQLLKTKQHFDVLDGLRGLAAVIVVIFHFMEIIIPDFTINVLAHGYLAVDFFFCLSGFVIAYAYDNRISKIGFITFIKLRLIRLHPLVVLGAVIGLVVFVFDPFVSLVDNYSLSQNIGMFLSACLMVPYPIVSERYYNIFHLNPPTWSLLWEYVANIIYAGILFKVRQKVLWVLTGLAAILLVYTVTIYGNLSIGWSGGNFWGGGARILYSFLAGMLVFRSGWIIKSKLGFKGMSALLMLAFLMPFSETMNVILEPLIVLFYLPFLVALGAGTQPARSERNVCVRSGEISYPLYMVHYPFIWLFYSYWERFSPSFREQVWIMCVGTPLLIAFAYVITMYLDIPVRKRLKATLRRKER